MAARLVRVVTVMLLVGSLRTALAQAPGTSPFVPRDVSTGGPAPGAGWRAADSESSTAKSPLRSESAASASESTKTQPLTPHEPIAKVTSGSGALPNDKGQVWREYDITPYTSRMTSNPKPEQAIVDWILRETSYEAWHSDPVCLLSADKKTLRVYHTPDMQAQVAEIVDRFVNPDAELNSFGLRVITVGSPNWRAKSLRTLHAIPTQTQAVQAWLLSKEDAALLFAELRKRSDVREQTAPNLMVYNGQTIIVSTMRPRNYTRNINLRADVWPAFEPEMAQLQEGFTLELSPLMSIDGRSSDAIVKCTIDQVEKLIPVALDVPTAVAPRQQTKVDVPQMTAFRLHERFRWPADQVMLVSFGVIATPTPGDSGGQWLLPTSGPGRAELLLLVDSRGKQSQPPPNVAGAPPRPGQQAPPR